MVVIPLFYCAAALTAADAAVEFANTTTTAIIASISMAHPSKNNEETVEPFRLQLKLMVFPLRET